MIPRPDMGKYDLGFDSVVTRARTLVRRLPRAEEGRTTGISVACTLIMTCLLMYFLSGAMKKFQFSDARIPEIDAMTNRLCAHATHVGSQPATYHTIIFIE